MSNEPRQTDLEEFIHDQDDPDFIGPRLPKDHPAYCAHITTRTMPPTPDQPTRKDYDNDQ